MGLFDNLFAQNDEEDYLLGVFSHAEADFTITVSRRPDQVYQGTIFVDGQQYLYEGIRLLGMLSGEYVYERKTVSFSLARMDGIYYFTTEGQSIELKRVNADPTKYAPGSSVTTQFSMSAQAPKQVTFSPATGPLMKDPYGTYTVHFPDGWMGKEANGALIGSKSGDKVQLTTSVHNYTSVQAIKAAVEPLVQDETQGIYLTSKVQDFGTNGVVITYEGMYQGSMYQIEVISLISPYGGGVTLAAAGTTDPPVFTQSHANYLKSMAGSVQFTKAPEGAEALKWNTSLKGKLLTYLSTSNGGTERVDIHLCSNGTYLRKYEGSYSSGGYADFSSVSANRDDGTWRIITRGAQAVLLLSNSTGSLQEFPITAGSASNEINLNGKRYFIQGSANCN
jgi:hypothetical protein